MNKKVIGNSTFLLIGNICGKLFYFLATIIIIRKAGYDTFGMFAYGLSVVMLLSTLLDLGVDKIFIREASKESKRISDLFEIMKKLDSDYKLTICGVGPLEDYVKIHLNENIHFIKTTDTPPLYRNHFILIMPSYWEGFPIVPLKALSSGYPVIAYHSPGLIEHPLKDYITFVRSKNIDEFVEKIRNFEYNYTQLKKARQLIERNFSIDAMGKKYCEVFKLWL